jgi:hypothetical protein
MGCKPGRKRRRKREEKNTNDKRARSKPPFYRKPPSRPSSRVATTPEAHDLHEVFPNGKTGYQGAYTPNPRRTGVSALFLIEE